MAEYDDFSGEDPTPEYPVWQSRMVSGTCSPYGFYIYRDEPVEYIIESSGWHLEACARELTQLREYAKLHPKGASDVSLMEAHMDRIREKVASYKL